ncbi:MAG: adenine phosphoribosyltransferase [Candidatus Eisenbacteria bacterium]|uniref:Adenine phosphoribosyltransferase n=1 Tax=Eiseniibacteriota bacterium TaxID=2212470 RepID=A0A849SI48_UNCEI|nr:adenine phosphoribosyltransferase [Candidatus Eisenbacteria bacterium]
MDTEVELRSYVRDVPNFPRPGILFKDITPLLASPRAFANCIRRLAGRVERPAAVVAIESRGFLFGAGLSLHWGVPLVLARKFGKLPGPTVRQVYSLEYGEDTLELHQDSLESGQAVVIVDDLLATGGTAAATAELARQLGATVSACLFVIELSGLGGRERLAEYPVEALLAYEVSE